MKKVFGVCAALCMCGFFQGTASADYSSPSEAGVNKLDFIENERRTMRENMLTEDQKALALAAEEMKKNLRFPLDPTKPSPIAVEGDELTYDQTTGEFSAIGKVQILQLEKRQLDTEGGMTGDLTKKYVNVPEKMHIIQLTEGAPRLSLDGFHAVYHYGTGEGTMEDVKGKVEHQYITGKRFEFQKDKIIAYDGTLTKSHAKNPSYYWKAKKIEIIGRDKVVLYDVGLHLFGKEIFHRARYEHTPGEDKHPIMPRVGYNSDDGAWISYPLNFSLAPNITTVGQLYASKESGGRSLCGVRWGSRDTSLSFVYGYYEDSDDRWLKRAPALLYHYGRKIGHGPYHYAIDYEIGRWEHGGIESTHQKAGIYLSRDRIYLGRDWTLDLGAGYTQTHEGYDNSTVKGISFDSTLIRKFDDRWAAYLGYYYTKNNAENLLFDYDTNDYAKKIETGFSYRTDDKNRFVVGTEINLEDWKRKEMDYYWFHDFEEAQIILSYREKRDRWHVSFAFTPW